MKTIHNVLCNATRNSNESRRIDERSCCTAGRLSEKEPGAKEMAGQTHANWAENGTVGSYSLYISKLLS